MATRKAKAAKDDGRWTCKFCGHGNYSLHVNPETQQIHARCEKCHKFFRLFARDQQLCDKMKNLVLFQATREGLLLKWPDWGFGLGGKRKRHTAKALPLFGE